MSNIWTYTTEVVKAELYIQCVFMENFSSLRASWFLLIKKKNKKIINKQVKRLCFDPPGGGLTIIESIWKSGNLPFLVANTYGLNFIKIGGIWIFRGAEAPY